MRSAAEHAPSTNTSADLAEFTAATLHAHLAELNWYTHQYRCCRARAASSDLAGNSLSRARGGLAMRSRGDGRLQCDIQYRTSVWLNPRSSIQDSYQT